MPVGCVAAGLVLLHFVLLWAERRGWIRYVRSGGSAGTAAGMFGEMQSLFGPAHRHTIEEIRRRELTSEQHVVADLDLGTVYLRPIERPAPQPRPDASRSPAAES